MTTSSPEMKILTTRLVQLTILASAALVLAVIALFLPLRSDVVPAATQTVEASEFVVHDEYGKLRGRWNVQGITFVDRDGRMRAGVSTGDTGAPGVTFVSKDGKIRATLGLGSDDAPGLTFHDRNGRVRARIAVTPDDAPHVTLYDEKGATLSEIPPPRVVASPSGTARTPTDKKARVRPR